MFQTVPLSIIMSFSPYTQQWYMSYRTAYSLRAGSGWNRVPSWSCSRAVWHTPLPCVQWKTPNDGQRNSPKHVVCYSKNKFEKFVHLVGFIRTAQYTPSKQFSTTCYKIRLQQPLKIHGYFKKKTYAIKTIRAYSKIKIIFWSSHSEQILRISPRLSDTNAGSADLKECVSCQQKLVHTWQYNLIMAASGVSNRLTINICIGTNRPN
jgi:hypothetical protein